MTELNTKQILSRIEKLEETVFGGRVQKIKEKQTKKFNDVNFGLNIKAFIKRYLAKMSGPKKFTLLLAYLAKGKVGEEIDIKTIKAKWSKRLGKFNDSFTNLAQTRGWVDSKTRGVYRLTNEWKKIFT